MESRGCLPPRAHTLGSSREMWLRTISKLRRRFLCLLSALPWQPSPRGRGGSEGCPRCGGFIEPAVCIRSIHPCVEAKLMPHPYPFRRASVWVPGGHKGKGDEQCIPKRTDPPLVRAAPRGGPRRSFRRGKRAHTSSPRWQRQL